MSIEDAKSDIQGFITSAYGHTYHSAYLFIGISDVAQAKEWLTDIIPLVQTSAPWTKDANGDKIKPERILNIAFTMQGLRKLPLSEMTLNSFPVEMQEGMHEAKRAKLLGDVEGSSSGNWQIGGEKYPFDILVLLHAGLTPDDDTEIKTYVDDISQGIESHGMSLTHLEWGHRRADDKEHFGFLDGISQPKIKGINKRNADGEEIKVNIVETGEFILGYKNQYHLKPGVPVVPVDEDPHNILPSLENPGHLYELYNDKPLKDIGTNGSYLVYRKLKQDVATFWNYLKDEISRLDGAITPERIVWLASKFVGRYPDGTPLVPHPENLKSLNGFLFAADDPDGMHCPFGSHIRRSNPRDVFFPTTPEVSLNTVDKHRLLRRGRLFGDALFDLSALNDKSNADALAILLNLKDDGQERGVNFFAVNANIQMQFEFIQDSWASNPHFNSLYQNKDPLMGDHGTTYQRENHMHIPHDPVRIRTSALPRFIHLLGGAYLFMPSITALRFLAR